MKQLQRNAGKSGILRILLVGLVMTMVALKGGGPVAVGLWLASLVLGWPSGKWMAADPEKRHGALKLLGMLLIGGAFVAGAIRDKVDLDEQMLICAMVTLVGLYLTAYVSFMSDSRVEISRG